MKLMIDIPEVFYEYCKAQEDAIEIQLAVKNGIPLDKIKKQINEQSTMHMDGELYIRNFDVKWILEGNEVSK